MLLKALVYLLVVYFENISPAALFIGGFGVDKCSLHKLGDNRFGADLEPVAQVR